MGRKPNALNNLSYEEFKDLYDNNTRDEIMEKFKCASATMHAVRVSHGIPRKISYNVCSNNPEEFSPII